MSVHQRFSSASIGWIKHARGSGAQWRELRSVDLSRRVESLFPGFLASCLIPALFELLPLRASSSFPDWERSHAVDVPR
jgi:hypothetical protein